MLALVPRPDRLPALEEQIATLATQISAASARLLECLREFDALEGWGLEGFRSCAHWLSWRVGLDLGAAREHVRVARALGGLPRVTAAFAAGALSYSKVRALTRIARSDTEEDLVGIGLAATAAQLERLARAYRRADPAAETARAEAQHEGRFLCAWHDNDGMLVIQARLPSEEGAVVLTALEAAEREAWAAARGAAPAAPATTAGASAVALPSAAVSASAGAHVSAEAPRPTATQRRADALVRVAERALGGQLAVAGERYQVVVHVDAAVLAAPAADGRCHLEHGPALAPETARRLACDATVVEVAHGPGGAVTVAAGRRTRTIPPALRRALAARDHGMCAFPGCTNRIADAHHVRHWAAGGPTELGNLISCCPAHHRLLHESGFGVRSDGRGGFEFTRPDGRVLPECPPPADEVAPLPAPVALAPVWGGEAIDYDWAVSGLLGRLPAPLNSANVSL